LAAFSSSSLVGIVSTVAEHIRIVVLSNVLMTSKSFFKNKESFSVLGVPGFPYKKTRLSFQGIYETVEVFSWKQAYFLMLVLEADQDISCPLCCSGSSLGTMFGESSCSPSSENSNI